MFVTHICDCASFLTGTRKRFGDESGDDELGSNFPTGRRKSGSGANKRQRLSVQVCLCLFVLSCLCVSAEQQEAARSVFELFLTLYAFITSVSPALKHTESVKQRKLARGCTLCPSNTDEGTMC